MTHFTFVTHTAITIILYNMTKQNTKQKATMKFLQWLLYLHSIGLVLSWISTSTSITSTRRRTVEQFLADVTSSVDLSFQNRPHIQRVTQQRPARRLNHAFKYLYRHTYNETVHSSDPLEYLQQHGGYSYEQIQSMNETFPPLLTLSVRQQLHPKMEFCRHTLGVTDPSQMVRTPYYFGARLEKILAPRHAFLVHHQLPHGPALFANSNCLWEEFMMHARNSKSFAALCQRWQLQKCTSQQNNTAVVVFTHQQVEAFDALFSRGLMAAARKEWNPSNSNNNHWALDYTNNTTAAQLIELLHQHGAHIHERDYQGASLLHWASGTGHVEGVQILLRLGLDVEVMAERDGATSLHWAAAGTTAREFGTGGHARVCEYLVEQATNPQAYVNQCTKDGNSPLMWASWSGTLETVQLLASHGAQTNGVMNRNGCTVAHWAASGGNVDVCQYLHTTLKVNFSVPNHGGNTPLTHAVAFGRSEVVEWLNSILEGGKDDPAALQLAQNFVQWQEGDDRRTNILQLLDKDDDDDKREG